MTGTEAQKRRIDVYDPTANTWSTDGSYPNSNFLMPAVIANDREIYALGSYTPANSLEVWHGTISPTLDIANAVILSWPTNFIGYTLQESQTLNGTYTNVNRPLFVDGTNYSVAVPTKSESFFRLTK